MLTGTVQARGAVLAVPSYDDDRLASSSLIVADAVSGFDEEIGTGRL
jgi:hypothetical protein